MLDHHDAGRLDRSSKDFDRPFGDPEVDLTPLPRRPWGDASHPELESMRPGHLSATFAAHVDRSELSGSDRVALLRAHQRLINHFQAELCRDMLAIRALLRDQEGIDDDVACGIATEAEVRAALGWSRRRAESELSLAIDLDARVPEVLEALGRGDIDMARARVIDRATLPLELETARRITAELLLDAPLLTTGELDARARKLVNDADAEASARRTAATRADRRVVMEPTDAGTGHIHALDLAPHDAAAIASRINHLARRAKSAGDERTHDQVRADVFVDLVLGSTTTASDGAEADDRAALETRSGVRADVEVRVDLATLAGLDDGAADLRGFGPIVADIARDLAHGSEGRWTFVATDGSTPVATGSIRRRPTARQAQVVRALRPACGFPGCRTPAANCELDHTRPWVSGGPTSESNLMPLCRHDHRVKSEAGWTYERRDDGRLAWTSPLGRTYRRGPPSG